MSSDLEIKNLKQQFFQIKNNVLKKVADNSLQYSQTLDAIREAEVLLLEDLPQLDNIYSDHQNSSEFLELAKLKSKMQEFITYCEAKLPEFDFNTVDKIEEYIQDLWQKTNQSRDKNMLLPKKYTVQAIENLYNIRDNYIDFAWHKSNDLDQIQKIEYLDSKIDGLISQFETDLIYSKA
jgi:hypothetical protein